jgi:NAD(P)-dependent dehydrogenase (short-subunit alcohol dehydrogenase family)
MSAQGSGVIINISSVSGNRPNPKGAAYGAAKAGLNNLTESLATEWGPDIRVLTVTVGLIVTEEADLFYGDAEGIARVGATIPARRMGTPEDIAPVVLFLASDESKFINGAAIRVDDAKSVIAGNV